MELVITLIGIITLSCGPKDLSGKTDPCVDGFRKKITMHIADGNTGSSVCKQDQPRIRPHFAFIRVSGAPAASGWPGAIQCSDEKAGRPCILYPLPKGTLTISDVSRGPGVSEIVGMKDGNLDDLRWTTHEPNLTLPSVPARAQTLMAIDNGTITMVPRYDGAFVTDITIKGVTRPQVVEVVTNSGRILTMTVPLTAKIDILNLPYALAMDDLNKPQHKHDDDCDHFFLHYQLAASPPDKDCQRPDDGLCKPLALPPHAGLSVSCSNSTYP